LIFLINNYALQLFNIINLLPINFKFMKPQKIFATLYRTLSLKIGLMKKILFLLLAFFLLHPVFSQDSPRDTLLAVHKQNKGSKKIIVAATPAVPELLLALQKPMTTQKKVDILYDIAGKYLDRLKIDSALFYAQKIKLLSDSAGYEAGLAKYYLARGSALYYRNMGNEVTQNLQQAISLFNKYNDKLFLGISYQQLARQLANARDYAGAQKLYSKAIPFLIASGDVSKLQWLVYNCGRNFYLTLELDSSAYYLSWSLKLAEQLQSKPKIFTSASMLGTVYFTADNNNEAERQLSYALSVQPPNAEKVHLRGILANYAEVLTAQGKYELATKTISEYDKINAVLGDVWGSMTEMKLKGSLSYRQGNYALALQYLQQGYKLKPGDNLFVHDIMNVVSYLGKTELKTGNADSAIVHFRLSKKLATESNFIAGILENNMLLAEAFQQNKQMDSAYHYFKYYSHLRDSILTFKKERTVMELSAKYDAEKREQQIKNLQNEKQVYNYELLLKNKTIEQQELIGLKNSQKLTLLTQQSEISRLQASEKSLELQNREKEFVKKQNELELLQKEKQLQSVLAAKQVQQKKLLLFITTATLLFVLYGAYRYRQNKQLSSRLSQSLTDLKLAQEQIIKSEKEKESENIRVSISRDIHDEVGATLSGVALFSEIAKQKVQQYRQKDALEYLEHISTNSKEMVEKISDIVWAINPDNDSFERITEKLRAYTLNLCAGKGIRLNFEVDEAINNLIPSMGVRRNIYLFSKEAINNAVKYSGCKELLFSLQQLNQYSLLKINDDGNGFEPGSVAKGNGLKNMNARANDMQADFELNSHPGLGTSIKLQFNFHPNGGHKLLE
jgi:signal transduction histidine kinase